MLKKLIASGSAAVLALSSLANGLVVAAPMVQDPELIEAVSWANENGLTKYSSAEAFMPFNNITREQEAKFASEFAATVLGTEADTSKDCTFADEASMDASLATSVMRACQMGIMMGHNGMFMPKQTLKRGELAILTSRMLDLIDPMASEQDHFAALQDAGIMNVANLSAPATREASVLMKYRIAMGSDSDLCAMDPSLPECVDNGNGGTTGSTSTGTTVKEGDLNVSLNPSSPANMSSIPNNGVSRFATVDFTAGSKDVSVNTVSLLRQGLSSYTAFAGGRMYFEIAGVRVSGRSSVSSDDTVTLSFAPALVVAAGKTVSVDLMAELNGASAGSEIAFKSTSIDSSAANVAGSIMTPTLRTANYSVRSVGFTSQNVLTTYQGNESTVELGKFQLQNIGANTIDANVKAITFRNVANGDAATSLSDLVLLRAGSVVSTKTIVSGRDITFVLADVVKDGQTASYTIQGKVVDVQNASGDTYKFILRQTTDLNATEANTGFRTAVAITANAANDTTVANQYTVNGGELKFVRDNSLSLSQNVSPGALSIELAKGTVTAKQAILLEDVLLNVTAGSATIHNVFKKVYLQIGQSVFTWTPDATTPANNAVAEFDGSVTVNGTVPVRIYADVYTNATAPSGPYTFGGISAASFTRKEYVANQNNVTSSIGSIAGSAVSVVASSLSVTKFDNLGTQVYATNNAQGKTIYGVRLSNNQSNVIKVGSITLTPSNGAFNNGASITLMKGADALATKTLNGATTFNGLNILVNQNSPVDLTFVADFQSTIVAPQSGTFAVSFNPGDVIDNVTSNNVTPTGTPATSAMVNIIAGGTVIATSNAANTDQGFMAPAMERKVGSINIQAINDDLEVRSIYLKVTGVGGFAANAGNQISNFKIKDSAGNVVATESARDTQTNSNDIVKFTSVVAGTKVLVGTSKVFNVYATANTVNDAASAGEFAVAIATTYDDPSYTDEYLGTRLYSVNAGLYVTASSVAATAIGNTLNVVSAYPTVSKMADGNATDLITIKVQNPGSTNLTIDAIQYYGSAQNDADLQVAATVYNGATVVGTTTLATDADTLLPITPITIAGGDFVTLNVRLNAPFSNTAVNPQSGNRVFQISNVRTAQTFANGSASAFGLVAAGYTNTVGLPVAASNY